MAIATNPTLMAIQNYSEKNLLASIQYYIRTRHRKKSKKTALLRIVISTGAQRSGEIWNAIALPLSFERRFLRFGRNDRGSLDFVGQWVGYMSLKSAPNTSAVKRQTSVSGSAKKRGVTRGR